MITIVRILLSGSVVLLLFSCSLGQSKNVCPPNPTRYKVLAIKVHMSFVFTDEARQQIDDAIKNAPNGLKVNGAFSSSAEDATWDAVRKISATRRQVVFANGPIVIPLLVLPKREACDNQAQTLESHYYVYSGDLLNPITSLFTGGLGAIGRATPATPLAKFVSATKPQPFVDFNRSRGIYGGAAFRHDFRNNLIDDVQVQSSASSSSAIAGASFHGSGDSDQPMLSHYEWRAGYDYSNIPSASDSLKRGKGYGQFIGASRQTSLGLILRYGLSEEAGISQSDLSALPSTNVVTSASYNSTKLFVGAAVQKEHQSFDVSYGIELGNTNGGPAADYVKHLVDTGYSIRFVPFDHRPLDIDARFGFGDLITRGKTPIGARFFGGNVEQNFIASDDWTIRNGPFIRSYPQNRFVPPGPTAALGGDRFVSFNLTVAPTLWGIPLVPKEVGGSKDFDTALALHLDLVKPVLYQQLLIEKGAPLRDFISDLLKTRADLDALQKTLTTLDGVLAPGSDAESIYQDTVLDTCTARQSLQRVALSLDEPVSQTMVCNVEVANVGSTLAWVDTLLLSKKASPASPLLGSDLYNLSCDLIQLVDALKKASAAPAEIIAALENISLKVESTRKTACKYTCMKEGATTGAQFDFGVDLASCESSSETGTGPMCPSPCTTYVSAMDLKSMENAREQAKRQTDETIDFSGRLFRRFAKEENRIAVAPLFMVDAAKVSSRNSLVVANRTAYGVGTGIQFTLVSLNLRLGYLFNVQRKVSDPHGAFVFSLNVSDLLR